MERESLLNTLQEVGKWALTLEFSCYAKITLLTYAL